MKRIFNPMTGLFNEFKDFDSKHFMNYIDHEKVKQIIYVCFEESLISSVSACQYLTNFVLNSFKYEIPSAIGLIKFSMNSKIVFELNPLFQNIEIKMLKDCRSKKNPHLWDSISFACEELQKDDSYKNAAKRILVFSNSAEDSGSKMSLNEISIKALNNKITIDSIIFNKTEKSKELVTLCHITGGYSFNPETVEEGLQLFDKISFLDLESRSQNRVTLIEGNRKTQPRYLTTSTLTNEFIQNAIVMSKFDQNVNNSLIDFIIRERHLTTPRHICYVNRKTSTPSSSRRRILKELHLASVFMNENDALYDSDVVVLPFHSTIDIWEVFLKGIENTPYEGKWFQLFVFFSEQYPIEPPIIQFISVPYHLNVSFDGKICLDFLNQSYEPNFHIIDIIQEIKQIFLINSFECPLRIDAYEAFMNDYDLYIKNAKETSEKVGKNDYNQFLPEYSNIDDDVNKDFLLNDDEIPLYMISQVNGIRLKDPVMASSGVYYEREELKQLISSHVNPICVITGKRLTDRIEDL